MWSGTLARAFPQHERIASSEGLSRYIYYTSDVTEAIELEVWALRTTKDAASYLKSP